MANTILVPITVSAKVILKLSQVPSLSGAPFNRNAVLEPGVHLHWALPDALTASRLLPAKGTRAVIFPSVPDLWLVIRFNPGASSSTPFAKRTWTGWVVDSIAQVKTPLAEWVPPIDRDPMRVHTFAGVLPDAGAVGHGGWGLWDTDPDAHPGQLTTFDPAMAAYYPESRRRFGFYDSLKDLPVKDKGKVSYLVVGWFWTDKHDQLGTSSYPAQVLDQWQAATAQLPSVFADMVPQVSFSPAVQSTPAWDVKLQPRSVRVPSPAKIEALKRSSARSGTADMQAKQLECMTVSFPVPTTAEDGTWAQVSAASSHLVVARETICHGSIVSVPLAGSNTAPAPIKNEDVKLYPNVKRALADLASKTGQPDQVNATEMLLADLDSQKYSTGGVLDMAGSAHALTFQSVPGHAKTYARIDIEPGPSNAARAHNFSLSPSATLVARAGSGYWPNLQARSASLVQKSRIATFPNITVFLVPSQPGVPDQKSPFIDTIKSSFKLAFDAAAAKGITLDQRMLRIQDSRTNARSLALGATTDGSGSDAAGWWIDLWDPKALEQLFETTAGAKVSMPFVDNIYELPGPRWYRPWSPQVVLSNIGRSYKFGFDTRFRTDKKVQTRTNGNTLLSMAFADKPAIFGSDLFVNPQSLDITGIPSVVVSLVRETLLLDTESAGTMAELAGGAQSIANTQSLYTYAIQGLHLARDRDFKSDVLNSISLTGEQPSPIAITPWQDPCDPLFIDSDYSHPHSGMERWKLDGSDVELTSVADPAVPPVPLPVEGFIERSIVTATVVNVLQSALLTRLTIDPTGQVTRNQVLDKNLDTDTFAKMDVVSAALTKFDSQLSSNGYRLRAGALRLNKLELVDMFGSWRTWDSGVPATSSVCDGGSPYCVSLPPRFPYWSRYDLRLTAADDRNVEANTVAGPVCGLLLPDFLEHALEVFDGEGYGLGQLTTDLPIHGQSAGVTLNVTYKPHPWLEPHPDPLHHIANETLKALVQSVMSQAIDVPAGPTLWAETGLSALLRTIDTIRGTFDTAAKTADRRVSLIGEPILVLAARLQLNGTLSDKTADLAGNPTLLTEMPSLKVRLGDVTRPDDGVLGLFVAGDAPKDGYFAPVTREAAEKALVNAISIFQAQGWAPVTHSFVQGHESVVTLTANQPVHIVILADIRNAIYATCGALPRKKITIPQSFVDAAIKNLEPSFYTGPILTTEQFGLEKALLPPPEVAGYAAEFLHQGIGSTQFTPVDVPASPPLGDLPKSRVLLTEGWLRMIPVKKSP